MEIDLINNSSVQISFDSAIYSTEVIHKCFYWYGDHYSVNINKKEDFFIVDVVEKSGKGQIESVVEKIKKDIIDFKTRDIINKETKNIREILIAKAFANDDEFAQNPPGNVNDPLGFDPTQI